MKKFTTLLFALLLTIPAIAANLAANSYIYFVKPDTWTQAKTQFMIGHDSWSQGYEMSKIANTNLYVWKSVQWDGYNAWAFINTDVVWGGEGTGITNRYIWGTNHSNNHGTTTLKKHNLCDIEGKAVTSDQENFLNHTQTFSVKGEGSVAVSSFTVANGVATATSGTTSVEAAYTATVTCTATPADGYQFIGWYVGEEVLANTATYTYTAENAEKTITAKFEEVTPDTPVLSNFTADVTELYVGETVVFSCEVANGDVNNIVYKINNNPIVGNTWTPEQVGSYTAIATYEGAEALELAQKIVVMDMLVFNVTVPEGTPACYIAGSFNEWVPVPMDEVNDTHYTFTLDIFDNSVITYKYTCSEGWDNVEVNADGSDVANRTWSENDVVAKFKGYEKYSENITYNNSYLLNINATDVDWKAADAKFGAWFYNKNMTENNAILVQGYPLVEKETGNTVDGVLLFYIDENHIKDKLGVGEAFNFTHVKFLRLNSSFVFDEDTDYTVEPNSSVWNSVDTYCPGSNKYFQLTGWDAGEWRDLNEATSVDRVEMAGGIGYAYGVVSAEGAIEVYNVNGAVVARGNDTIDLRGLGRGVYIIRNGNQVRKVVR